jgi:hypothetical protein
VVQANQSLCDALSDARAASREKPTDALFGKPFNDFAPFVKM